jgi:uncharacterized protein (DUF1684 family)
VTLGLWLALGSAGVLAAQMPSDLARERADYREWLGTALTSPLAAVAQQPIGAGLRLGPPDADVPLAGVPEHRITQRGGAVALEEPGARRAVPRGAPMRLGSYTLVADGAAGHAVLTVFGPSRAERPGTERPPAYYDYQPSLAFTGPLTPAEQVERVRVLGVDGIEVEAAEAGSVVVPLGGKRVRLRVLRLPTGGGEESELEIYFQDATNGHGSYPAGRFVALVPAGDQAYRLDFNRARNPFCAYSSAYPCPAPWRGNTITAPVPAGERYQGGGPAGSGAAPGAP